MLSVLSILAFSLAVLLFAEWQLARPHPQNAKGWFLLAAISKTLASGLFILFFYLFSPALNEFGYWILIALCFSLLGDSLLLPKKNPIAFKLGIAAFALAHIAYSLAFFPLITNWLYLLILSGLNLGLAGLIYWLLAPYLSGGFKPLVPLYLVIIVVMVTFGETASLEGYPALIGIGSLLFAISDVFVARNRFVSPGIVNRIIGLPLYYLAQVMIAYGAILHLSKG